jgi:hypothetical protein
MQLDFEQLQAKQVELLSANTFFNACPVHNDDGNKKSAIEQSLIDTGACLLVCPILYGRRGSQATHQITLDAGNVVKLIINPKRNADPGGAAIGTLPAIHQIIRTILAYGRTAGDTFWRVPEETVVINTFEPGLRIYDVFFEKQFVIS